MSVTQMASICKDHIFKEGRLIERLLFGYYFGNIQQYQCLAALKAYQNSDGGFGNGLEQDILCPNSSAIATETALFYIEMLNAYQGSIVEDIHYWVRHNIRVDGTIKHPPIDFHKYPTQPWWSKVDKWRSLAIIGQLKRLKKFYENDLCEGLKTLNKAFILERDIKFYDYPYYLYNYALFGSSNPSIEHLLRNLPEFLEQNKQYYPLFSRYWHWLLPEVPSEIIKGELNTIVKDIKINGKLPNPYTDLPAWNATFTLDALMILNKLEHN
ncbi:hypothetical protein IMX26_11095 [Clostridium sp. 'deep sea']|uniref:hypothetical protein n=1 Tax=Clostridium sp. 'deep sea' TaxID=2779445 RepID=UPI0018965E5B|nr:hypothetical protein [Clostridium sp. 'deep sea']QOR34036.1 hypothetical protein IMX26_11095 [Clostridium sp. 'deep sea']